MMSVKYTLRDEFREPFIRYTDQLRLHQEVLSLADFSNLVVFSIFNWESDDEEENDKLFLCKDFINKMFQDNEEYLDNKLKVLDEQINEQSSIFTLQAIVTLWASLESFFKDFLSKWIYYNEDILDIEEVSNLKIQLGDYHQLDDEERSIFVTELLLEKTKFNLLSGITKFESTLKVFNLSGKFDLEEKKNIFTLQKIRNCIVHNNAIADNKFVKYCPYLNYQVGDRLKINKDEYNKFFASVNNYVVEIFIRIHQFAGATDKTIRKMRKSWKEHRSINQMDLL